MAYSLEFEQWLPVPTEKVFRFFADPRNLPLIEPEDYDVRVLGAKLVPREEGEPDLKVLVSFRPLPSLPFIRLRWVLLITDFEFGKSFRDVQLAGPFKAWEHIHEFSSVARDGQAGTTVRDVLTYELPVPLLGGIVNALFIRPRFKKMFAGRQKSVEDLLSREDVPASDNSTA